MTKKYKNPFEDPDAEFYGKKVKDYKIPKRRKAPLEKKVENETLKKEKDEPRANIHIWKSYLFASKRGAKALNKIFDEYGSDITSIGWLGAYTEGNVKFEDMDILKAIKKGKKFTKFETYGGSTTIKADRSGTNVTIEYEGGFWSSIKVRLYGKESAVEKEREILEKLLGGKK